MYKPTQYVRAPYYELLPEKLSSFQVATCISSMRQLLKERNSKFESERVYFLDNFYWQQVNGFATNEQARDLLWFYQYFLWKQGRATEPFPTADYRKDPSVPLSEVESDLVGYELENMPIPTLLSGDPKMTGHQILDVLSAFERFMKSLLVVQTHAQTWTNRLRAYLMHIKHKFKWFQPTDEFEKTVFIHAFMTSFYGVFKDGTSAANLPDSETSDTLVLSIGEKLRKMYLPGPKISYLPVASTATKEFLVSFCYPKTDKIVISAGTGMVQGPLTELIEMKEHFSLEWTDAQQLQAISMQMAAAKTDVSWLYSDGVQITGQVSSIHDAGNSTVYCVGKRRITRSGANMVEYTGPERRCFIPMIYDMPEVRVVYRDEVPMYEWHSRGVDRMATSSDGAAILQDIRMHATRVGGTSTGRASLDISGFVYLNRITDRYEVVSGGRTKMAIVFKKNGVAKTDVELDMDWHVRAYGKLLIKPAFGEYLRVTLEALTTPRDDILSFIAGHPKLELNKLDRHMSKMAMTICYNYWWYSYFVGTTPKLPTKVDGQTDTQALIAYASSVAFGEIPTTQTGDNK